MPSYDLVVYGDNPWGVCAAVAAKKVAPSISVALVVDRPDLTEKDAASGGFSSTRRLGGIYSVGGETEWDDYGVAGGTYRHEIYDRTGRSYKPDFLSGVLESMLSRRGIDILFGYHVSDLLSSGNSAGRQVISGIKLRPIAFGQDLQCVWDHRRPTVQLNADFFIDASVDGRLIRMASPESLTLGRYDWPAEYLTPAERSGGLTQSATICIRLANFRTGGEPSGEWRKPYLRKDGAIRAYNLDLFKRTSGRILCGPGDWEAEDSATVWATGAHVFGVDARAFEKDRGTDVFPKDMPDGALTCDEGYAMLRAEIESGRWIEALREGLEMPDLELLAVAGTMYVRESAHSVLDPSRRGQGTENANYAILARDAVHAGYAGLAGEDGRHFWQRIGVAFYGIDLHAYAFRDLFDEASGTFFWRPDVEERMRPDLSKVRYAAWNPRFGVWLPFEAIVSRSVSNVLLCGYAISASSIAWGEIREAPNLCVLGDACGAAAGILATRGEFEGDAMNVLGRTSFIGLLQDELENTILANLSEKRRAYRVIGQAA